MAQLSSLIPLVRERCGGVIEQIMKDQLNRAYQKFCIESRFLARSEQFTESDAELTIDANHVFVGVDFVLDANGNELERGIDYNVSLIGEVTLTTNTPVYRVFYHIAPQIFITDTFEADNTIVNRWADAIADGAAANIKIMPNTAWYDLSMADYYKRRFTDGYREAYRAAVNALDEQRPTKSRDFF